MTRILVTGDVVAMHVVAMLDRRNAEIAALRAERDALRAEVADRQQAWRLFNEERETTTALRAERDSLEADLAIYIARYSEIHAERESFYLHYRMKCDEHTKALDVECERLRAERDALHAALRAFTVSELGGHCQVCGQHWIVRAPERHGKGCLAAPRQEGA